MWMEPLSSSLNPLLTSPTSFWESLSTAIIDGLRITKLRNLSTRSRKILEIETLLSSE